MNAPAGSELGRCNCEAAFCLAVHAEGSCPEAAVQKKTVFGLTARLCAGCLRAWKIADEAAVEAEDGVR